jgi:hypothetical protein
MPEYHKKMRKAFVEGRKSGPIHSWKWNEILKEPTEELRRKMFSNI